jgi:hypothetical protein
LSIINKIIKKQNLPIFLFLSVAVLDILSIKVSFNIVYLYLLAIVIVYILYENINIFRNNNRVSIFIILFIFYLIFNHIFLSLDKEISFKYTLTYGLWLFLFYIFSKAPIPEKEAFLKSLKFLHSFLFTYLILSFISSIFVFHERIYSIVAVLGVGGFSPNGIVLYIIFFLSLTLILYDEKAIGKKLYIASIFVFIVTFFYARSRGAIVSIFLASFILFYIKNKYITNIRIVGSLLATLLLYSIFIINTFDINFQNAYALKIINSVNSVFGVNDIEDFDVSAGRIDMYSFGLVVFENIRFFFFGLGLEAYRSFYDLFQGDFSEYFGRNNVTLHSVPLQHLVGLGALGLLFYFFIFKHVSGLVGKVKNKKMRSILKFFMLVIFINSFFSSALLNRILLFYMPILVYYCLYFGKDKSIN